MHQYRIVAQISLILPILNFVLAAPTVVQKIHEAHEDKRHVTEDGAAMPKEWHNSEFEVAPDITTSPHSPYSPLDVMPSPQDLSTVDGSTSPHSSLDEIASPQHPSSLDGSTSSGYVTPYLSSDESVSGYSWLADRPPRLSLDRPPSASSSSALSEMELPEWAQGLAWEAHHPQLFPQAPSPHPSLASSGSEISLPQWWRETVLWTPPDSATAESYSPSDGFTPSRYPSSISSTDSLPWHVENLMFEPTPYLSASDGSLSSQYFSASDGLVPSYNSESEGSPSSPPPPTESPLEKTKFLSESMIKKLKIVAAVVIVGSAIAGIVGSQIKHRDCQDC